jgi:hypothetical protein
MFVTDDTALVDAVSAGSPGGDVTDGVATPVLITRRADPTLDSAVLQFAQEHNVKRAEIVGGTAAVHANIDAQLRNAGLEVVRFAGSDRYETNALLAAEKFPTPSTIIVVRGDAQDLTGGANTILTAVLANAMGGQMAAPVLFVRGQEVPEATEQYITARADGIALTYVIADFRSLTDAVVNYIGSIM